jgi:3'-phosphoadenosine 5'-phosphosulfate sulfotransferase (PAPS reductase)/FAD synthetase
MSKSAQQSFTTPEKRTREVLRRCAKETDPDEVFLTVSGGTDSVVAADVMCRYGPEYDIQPDTILHINTGAAVPQTELVARIVADMHDLAFIRQGYRNDQDSLAERILANGWPGGYGGSPATGGHGLEWANRKSKPMGKVYADLDGQQLWVSGARKLESKKRNGNVPDSGIESDKPRRTWVSPIGGWTTAEKRRYIRERGLPVSETYLLLGFSGECTACSFDSQGLLTGLDLLCPELAHSIRTLALWLYQRAKRGDVDIDPKQLCWGWEPDKTVVQEPDGSPDTAQEMIGCDPESCGGEIDAQWITELPQNQLVTRQDVCSWWDTNALPSRFPV